MQVQPLNFAESRLLSAFRALPDAAKVRLFQSIDELVEAFEDEADSQDAERILARIRSGEEEALRFDDVVKQLGLSVKEA